MLRTLLVALFFSISIVLFGQTKEESIKAMKGDVEELAHKKYKGREAGTKQEKVLGVVTEDQEYFTVDARHRWRILGHWNSPGADQIS